MEALACTLVWVRPYPVLHQSVEMRPGRQHGTEHGQHLLLDPADPRHQAAEDAGKSHFIDDVLEDSRCETTDPAQSLKHDESLREGRDPRTQHLLVLPAGTFTVTPHLLQASYPWRPLVADLSVVLCLVLSVCPAAAGRCDAR